MSVLLDGAATLENGCEWNGTWYYSKEKTPSYSFKYTRNGDTIPSDLLEFVSFYTSPAKKSKRGQSRSRRGSKNRLNSSRRRSRMATTISAAAVAASLAAAAVDGGAGSPGTIDNNSTAAATAHAQSDGAEGSAMDVDIEDEGGAEGEGDDNDNDVDNDDGEEEEEGDGDGEDETKDADDQADNGMADEADGISTADIAQIAADSGLLRAQEQNGAGPGPGLAATRIPSDHPLFGVWSGTFDCMEPVPGGEHAVAETFFLHSYLGHPEQKALRCLPAQSYFTFSALRAATVPLLPPALMPKASKQSPNTAAKNHGDAASAASADPTLGSDQNDDAVHEVRALIRSAAQGGLHKAATGVATASAPGAGAALAGAESPAATTNAPEVADPDAVTDGSGSSPLLIFVGFGRNQFGRFSLTASFNRDTNSMIAEKRYMHTKSATTQRKGRRSTEPVELDPMTTRPRPNPIDLASLGGTGGRRKRANTGAYYSRRGSEDFAYGDDEEFYGIGASNTSHRRSRQSSVHTDANAEAVVPEPELDAEDSLDYRGACYDETSGEVYEGGWRTHRRHGRGIVLYADGSMYEGQWVNGKEHGHGQLMTSDRKVLYSGEWVEGLMHGHGSYNFFSGDRYVGDWREGNRHGKGEFVTRDGCKYVGDWRENRRSGRGVFSWLDGSRYDGEWDEDSRHGKGHLTLATGFSYEGLWCRNFFDGRGITLFPDGQKYEGTYKAGLREGRGSVTFPEGAVYEGRFRDDRLDGQGTIKVTRSVPGAEEGERLVPIEIQADMRRIHLKAGFGEGGHH